MKQFRESMEEEFKYFSELKDVNPTILQELKEYADYNFSEDRSLKQSIVGSIDSIFNDALNRYSEKLVAEVGGNSSAADRSVLEMKFNFKVKDTDNKALFVTSLDSALSNLDIEGGYRKPTYKDLFLVKVVLFPVSIISSLRRLYRFNISSALSNEEKAEESIGSVLWTTLGEKEKLAMIQNEVWSPFAKPYMQILDELSEQQTDAREQAERAQAEAENNDTSPQVDANKKLLKRLKKKNK